MKYLSQKVDHKKVSVVFCADDNYARYCAITITSAFLNTASPEQISIYIVSPGISEEKTKLLNQLCSYFNSELTILPIDFELFKELPELQHLTLNTYSRISAPEICETCERVIYLDSDVIVLGDLINLFQYELQNKILGAVPHVQFPYQKDFLENFEIGASAEEGIYFNGGVMLVDAIRWRKESCTEAVLKFARDHADKLHFGDQDALNAIFWNDYFHLPGVWNVEARLYREKLLGLPQTPEITKRMKNPKIIHYTGSDKPWSSQEYVPARSLYTYYSNKLTELTGWFPSKPETQRASVGSYLRFAYSCLYFRASFNSKKMLSSLSSRL